MDLSEGATPTSRVMRHLESVALWLLTGVAENGLGLSFLGNGKYECVRVSITCGFGECRYRRHQ